MFARRWFRLLLHTTGLAVTGALALAGCAATPMPHNYDAAPSWQAYPDDLVRPGRDPRLRETWWTWQQHRIHVDVWTPTSTPRATVVLVHGGGGHGRLLATYAASLVDHDVEVLAPDLPLYGLSVVHDRRTVTFSTWVNCVSSLAQAHHVAGRPLLLVGASLGGTVALYAAAQTPAVDAVVATTLLPVHDPDVMRQVSTSAMGVDALLVLGPLVDGFDVEAGALAPLDKMSSRTDVVDALADDPLVGRRDVPLAFFRSFLQAQPPVPLAEVRTPVVLAHPAQDRWTPLALSTPTLNALGGATRLVLLEKATHFPLEEPGRSQLEAEMLRVVASLEDQTR